MEAYVFGYLPQALVDYLSGQWNLTLCLTMSTSMFCEYCGMYHYADFSFLLNICIHRGWVIYSSTLN